MQLLNANGERGEHPPSWYKATCETPSYEQLTVDTACDVCIIGAGYTGLSAAIELRKQGHSVIVLEAHRVGWGASGRNGGQLGSGLNMDQFQLEKAYGREQAHALWQVCENAKSTVQTLCTEFKIDAKRKPGIINALHRARFMSDANRYVEKLKADYNYSQLQILPKSELRLLLDSPLYAGGVIDHGAAHIHPLALASGMGKAANSLGAILYELSEATSVKHEANGSSVIGTQYGSVRAESVVYACNGYLDALNPKVQRYVMPINNFVVATEPLGDRAYTLLPKDNAVFDSRFVVNYFRLTHDKRLLFGGGETYGYRFPSDIRALVRKPLLQVFPQLDDVQIEFAWGGTLAITMNRVPFVRQLQPNVYSASGYSGHGVSLAVETGKLIALAINGEPEQFNTLAALKTPRFPGSTHTRSLLLKAGMSWYALRDKF